MNGIIGYLQQQVSRRLVIGEYWVLVALLLGFASNSYSSAQPIKPAQTMEQRAAAPLVMLLMSNDHEMFKKAYSDSSDVDGDGRIDSGYMDSLDYAGYFNSDWCYAYRSGRFSPEARATGANGHHCRTLGAPWSGNFLTGVP